MPFALARFTDRRLALLSAPLLCSFTTPCRLYSAQCEHTATATRLVDRIIKQFGLASEALVERWDYPGCAERVDYVEKERGPQKLLFCGWRRDMDDMIMELDTYVKPGSELWLLSSVPIQVWHLPLAWWPCRCCHSHCCRVLALWSLEQFFRYI